MGNGSHIRIPESVLRNFENEKRTLYQWNFETGRITPGRAASINTEVGYYSETIELLLSQKVETPFGNVMKFFKGINKEEPQFSLQQTVKDDIRRFAHSLAVRSERMVELISTTSEHYRKLPRQKQHDVAVSLGLDEARNMGIFDDWEFTFSVNESSIPFVLPLCGSYSFSYGGDTMFSIPFAPNYAITFMPRSVAYAKYVVGETMRLLLVPSDVKAMQFNRIALDAERKDGNKGIIASTKDVLIMLKESDA